MSCISLYFDNEINTKYYEELNKGFEILFELKELSKIQGIPFLKLSKQILNLKTNAKKVLSIDNFVRECEFKEKTKYLTNTFLENFDAVRVEDLGLAYFIKEKFPSVKIQIILENFCHNINAIKEIKKVFGTSLQKIIISSELEFNTIKELINNKINIEVSLFSNILIFQTPRKLMPSSKFDTYFLNSKEIPDHNNLRYICDKHGSFIFYPENFNILKDYEKLAEIGVKNFRIDFRFLKTDEKKEILNNLILGTSPKDLKIASFYNPIFFNTNDSDLLFKNLKKKSFTTLPNAEVIATLSGKYAVIYTYKDFDAKKEITYITGDKTSLNATLECFTINDKEISNLEKNKIYYIKWLKRICVGSVIY